MKRNYTSVKDGAVAQRVVLPHYTLDLALVLLPGILYNVAFSRYKAAALLARFQAQVGHMDAVRALVAEFDLDEPPISDDAAEGIRQVCAAEQVAKKSMRSRKVPDVEPADLDWLVLGVLPNVARIAGGLAPEQPTLTIVRIVGLVEDTASVKMTLQALARATLRSRESGEVVLDVHWVDKVPNLAGHIESLKLLTTAMFLAIDRFVAEYRAAVAKLGQDKPDLVTLNPLANALFLQLAGSKDFAKAYVNLQKIVAVADSVDARGLSRIVDLIAAIVPFPNHERLRMLNTVLLAQRVKEATAMMVKETEVFRTLKETLAMATLWFNGEATNIQRATVMANQLKSIRQVLEGLANKSEEKSAGKERPEARKKPLQREEEEDDDLKAIGDFVKNKLPNILLLSEDSKRLIAKDFRRIKQSPPGNSDYHVIRNYLEIVADLPWDQFVARYGNTEIDVAAAKRQLDEDHHGLDHVKQRLVQYLVVLKLLGANASREFERSQAREAARSRKFTRELSNGETIIIPNQDETRSAKEHARTSIQHSRIALEDAKLLLVLRASKAPILMLAGPPGVGKTSLARLIANVLGRKFQRVSLGGVKDELEIRGHRRTYVGAMPGTIIQALRKAGSMNPVILLDEIDKLVGGANARFNGDPAAALLEVLDPEQNTQFMDHYLGFPVDLLQVIFVCTANEPHNLSRPLLDRLEHIDIGAYDHGEKLAIGHKYLLPRQVRRNGFENDSLVSIDDAVMRRVILGYTREAGVRGFERQLGTICRCKAVEYSESLADASRLYNPKVEELDLPRYLGLPLPSMSADLADIPSQLRYGVVNGLSYNGDGSGSVLVFESIGFVAEKGSLNMTGRLGEVLMESAKIGLTFVKNTLARGVLNVDAPSLLARLNALEIHMHVPSGAVSKDGPSAGITMALLFLSLVLEKPVPSTVAMTGEITLRGLVLPIGGLKEKMLGAHLTGHIQKIIVPRENRRDIIEEYVRKINDPSKMNELLQDNAGDYEIHAPEEYFADKYGVQVVYAREFWDVVRHVWGDELLKSDERMEYRL